MKEKVSLVIKKSRQFVTWNIKMTLIGSGLCMMMEVRYSKWNQMKKLDEMHKRG